MIDLIIKYLLIVLLVLQIVVLIHLIICQIKRHKEDKKFWEAMGKTMKQQVDKYNSLYPDEPIKLEEDNTSEQNK